MDLWVEKYRPKTVSEFIFKNSKHKEQVESWINGGLVPAHLLLSGVQGTGKTSLAKLCFNEFISKGNLVKADVLEINASNDRNIDTLRDRIIGFCSTWSLSGGIKYVLLDEADYLNPNSVQPALRNVMEKYSESVRFILTANYPNKIIPPLHSRLQHIHFDDVDIEDMFSKMCFILKQEGIKYNAEVLVEYVDSCFPDMRKCINLMQQNSFSKVLESLTEERSDFAPEYLENAVNLIKNRKTTEARKLIIAKTPKEKYDSLYSYMYKNLDIWSKDEEIQNEAIIIIAKYLKDDALVADREINLSACLIELMKLGG